MTARPQDVALLPLPQELIDALGEYGCARSDGVSDPVRLYRWQLVCDWIKDYAEDNVTAALASAQAREDELRAALGRLRRAGGLLANIAYNMAQNDSLHADLRWSLDDARKRWDQANKHNNAALSTNAAQPGETT